MPAILRIDVNKPFLMWGSAPRPRKPCKSLNKALTKELVYLIRWGILNLAKRRERT
jgi:hypothetical protein